MELEGADANLERFGPSVRSKSAVSQAQAGPLETVANSPEECLVQRH